MKHKTIKSLNTLSKVKRLELIDKQEALAEMQLKLQQLNQKVKDIAASRTFEIECSRADPSTRIELQNYLHGLDRREKALKKQIYHLADFMIPVQESVRDSFRDVKSLEITAETLQNQIREQREKHEQAFLDEISIQTRVRQND